MNRIVRTGSILACLIALASAEAETQSLMDSIDLIAAEREETRVWDRALEELSGESLGPGARPELRLRVEQDQVDDENSFGGAVRWRLDDGDPKWFLENEQERAERVLRLEREIALGRARNLLKRECLRLAYLKSKHDLLENQTRIEREQLAVSNARIELGEDDRLRQLNLRMAMAKTGGETEALLLEIERIENSLASQGISASIFGDLVLGRGWELIVLNGENGDWLNASDSIAVRLFQDHPEIALLATADELAGDFLERARQRSKLNLSYLQLEYEQERDSSRNLDDEIVGLSIGVNLPFWNRGELTRERLSEGASIAERASKRSKIESAIDEAVRELQLARDRFDRQQTRWMALETELRAFLESSNGSDGIAANQRFNLEKGRIEIQIESADAKYRLYETALDFEALAHAEILVHHLSNP